MLKNLFAILIVLYSISHLSAQDSDSLNTQKLAPVTIVAEPSIESISRLAPVKEAYIFSGKKTEVISLAVLDANISEKTGRQLFAKIPGVFVYDMEGSNQINISTRGLDPHRSWEFNIRKDGILANSDLYAYPASHYSIPMESVERIELVRGTGSLQYGAQFGGMLNYVAKEGDSSKRFGFESFNSVGSYNLLSSYNAIGGKINKIRYYAYHIQRNRDGYRENEHTNYDAQGIKLSYQISDDLSLGLDWVRSNYTYRIPGPLNDAMFGQNPRQATRFRNYFNPEINIPSLTLKWKIAPNTELKISSSALIGQRRSVIFEGTATTKDTINAQTLQYNHRQVDIDRFNSYTQEIRLLQHYNLGATKHCLAVGIQLINNHLHRTQLGKGTTGINYDLSLANPEWGRNMHFKTNNLAFFVENSFHLTEKLALNLGARIESGKSDMDGKIVYYPENQIPVSIKRQFPLLGGSFQYDITEKNELYGGISQTYRPMLFKDVVPGSVFEKVDPNLQDASGYNAEIGWRGKHKFLKWDITGFLLQYNNRFGTLAMSDAEGNFFTYRTNVGNSLAKGIELFLQATWPIGKQSQLAVFTSTSIMENKYISGRLKSGNQNINLKGKQVESVPNIIARNGLTLRHKRLSTTLLVSYTSKSYADPLNTEKSNPTGTVGLVPQYTILDFNATYQVSPQIEIRASLNNLTDKSYFTKRPVFYPGPGIWSSDGRNGGLSLVFRL